MRDAYRSSENRRVASSRRDQDGERSEEEEGWWERRPVHLSHEKFVQVVSSGKVHNLNDKSSKGNIHNFGIPATTFC